MIAIFTKSSDESIQKHIAQALYAIALAKALKAQLYHR